MKRIMPVFYAAALLLTGSASAGGRDSYNAFIRGLLYEREGRMQEALEEYRRTIELDPDSVYVRKQAVKAAVLTGSAVEAMDWADFIIASDSSTAENWVLYGNALAVDGKQEKAAEAYEAALKIDAENEEAVYQLASIWSSSDRKKSIGYLNRFLELRPDAAAEVHYQLALMHSLAGDKAKTLSELIKSKDADGFYPAPRYVLAGMYESENKPEKALAEYKELLSIDAANPSLYSRIGELYASPAINDMVSAEKSFISAYNLDSSNPTACFWLSLISESRGDYDSAARYLGGSADLDSNPALSMRLAYYYTQNGGYKEAVELLEKVYAAFPENKEAAYFLALGYSDTGRPALSRRVLEILLKDAPEYPGARMQHGIVCEALNDMEAAERSFRMVLSEQPENPVVLNYLGYSLADRGLKLEEARKLIEKAAELEPGNGAFEDSLAWVNYKSGNIAGAVLHIDKALSVLPMDPTIMDHAGQIYQSAGNSRAAWIHFNRLMALNPDYPGADKVSVRLKKIQKSIPSSSAAALRAKMLSGLWPAGEEFSAFASLKGKAGRKDLTLKAVIHYAADGRLSVSLLDPMGMPACSIKAGGGVLPEQDCGRLSFLPEEALETGTAIVSEAAALFSGEWAAVMKPSSSGWKASSFTAGERKIKLDKSLLKPSRIISATSAGKLTVKPGDYFQYGGVLRPGSLFFKGRFFSVELKLDMKSLRFPAPVTASTAAEE